ncbi:Lar family restriction alleviation protein [Cronobacter sakazakii]
MTLSKLIESEVAGFFAGFGGPGEPDIQSGEAQRQLTERLLSVLALREQAEPVAGENLPCPFCGGACDPAGWLSDQTSGPECENCGATAENIEAWNRRTAAPAPVPVVPDDVLEDAKILGAGFLKVLADGETHRLDPQKVIVTFKNESGQPVASWWLNGDFSAEISRQTDAPPAPGKEG